MGAARRFVAVPIWALLLVIGLLVGWCIPGYYDWTGSNQGRWQPVVGQTAWGLVVAAIIVWAVLPWVPCAAEVPRVDRTLRLRFTTRTMFLVTTGIACFLALVMTFPR